MFPLVSVWLWHDEPGNYTHQILLARNYSLIAKSGTSFLIWRSEILHFVCLWHLFTDICMYQLAFSFGSPSFSATISNIKTGVSIAMCMCYA